MAERRFFSGRTVEQAVLEAARHHGLEPAQVAYRLRDTSRAVKARGKTVIEVDPSAPDAANETEVGVRSAVERVLAVGGLDVLARPLAGGEEGWVEIDLDGPDRELLWQDGGEVLRAVEVLTGLALRKESGQVDWSLDCAGRQRGHREELRSQARRLAEEVRQTGEPRAFEAQEPAERRIVHLALRDEPGVVTQSEGRDADRRVWVRPAPLDA